MKRIVFFFFTVIMCTGLVAAAGRPEATVEPSEDKGLTIGMVTLQMRSPYFIAMVRSVEEAAREYPNVRVIVADGNGDVAKVSSDIEDLIAQGVDGFIMNISPLEALPGPMAAINAARIPVVLVNRKLVGADYNVWIGVDNNKIGVGVGEQIAKSMDGRGVLLMMRGGPVDNSTGNARRDGVLSKVQGTNIEVIFAPEFGGWSEDGGFRIMEDMLARHARIDAVFAENDSMALGAQKAIGDAGRSGQIKVFGFDGQKEALRQIQIGSNFVATGLNSASLIGKMGFQNLMSIIDGATPRERDIIFPVTVITRDNVNQYYDPNSIF